MKTIVNSHGSKVKSFFLLPGTDQTVLRKARGVEVAPLKVKVVIILNFGLDSIGGSFLFYFKIFVGTFFSSYKPESESNSSHLV